MMLSHILEASVYQIMSEVLAGQSTSDYTDIKIYRNCLQEGPTIGLFRVSFLASQMHTIKVPSLEPEIVILSCIHQAYYEERVC